MTPQTTRTTSVTRMLTVKFSNGSHSFIITPKQASPVTLRDVRRLLQVRLAAKVLGRALAASVNTWFSVTTETQRVRTITK